MLEGFLIGLENLLQPLSLFIVLAATLVGFLGGAMLVLFLLYYFCHFHMV